MHPVEPRLFGQVEIEHGKVRHRADPRRIGGAAETGMLGHQQLVMFRQRIEERQPFRHLARTVQEQYSRPPPSFPRWLAVHEAGYAIARIQLVAVWNLT